MPLRPPELLSTSRAFGGWVKRYTHHSRVLDCDMTFAIYLPPAAEDGPVPLLWWLSGLTCTEENFMHKAGAQRVAAELGIAIVCPDTSPRGLDLPGEHDDYDFGSGAGFYVNATTEPWRHHYQMYAYVADELPTLVADHFPVTDRQAISGHSMGGHGALVMALRHPGRFASVSALAPIANPMECPWGHRAFEGYLGPDREAWKAWDATELIRAGAGKGQPLFIDQGDADGFYQEGQLRPEALAEACEAAGVPLTLRMQHGYDHSFYFVSTFIGDHLRYAAQHLFA